LPLRPPWTPSSPPPPPQNPSPPASPCSAEQSTHASTNPPPRRSTPAPAPYWSTARRRSSPAAAPLALYPALCTGIAHRSNTSPPPVNTSAPQFLAAAASLATLTPPLPPQEHPAST